MSYKVTLQPSGRDYQVEKDESVLDAALRNGIALPYGCRNGTCSSCKGKIVEGGVDYPDGWPKALSKPEAEAGWALLCRAIPAGDLTVGAREISIAADLPTRTLPCRVLSKEQVAHDVMVVQLKLPEGESLQYLPGQYVDILLRDGRRRSFSLASPPREELLSLHIRHVPGGEFSGYVFNHLKERALLRLRGPLGAFFLRESADRPLIFLAGGTGFAPIKSIIEAALAKGESRTMWLYWGVRARRDLYLHELAVEWAATYPNLHYVPVLSEPEPDDDWHGRTGFVHQAVFEDIADLSPYEVYSSGPPVMIDAAWATFAERGLEPEHHFSDAFEFAYETGADTI